MEKEMGEKFKNDADFQNAMKEARQSEIRALKSYYESIKNDKEFRNDHVLEILREIFEPKNNEIENAKKLLERCGYKVMK
ncbi:MAG: hypothetical protein NTU57_00340 [Candidatus Aenigmarchaeota archaeon]|nr:hypothetical protein [Candidatus Aenigmarchaeota archaeon]